MGVIKVDPDSGQDATEQKIPILRNLSIAIKKQRDQRKRGSQGRFYLFGRVILSNYATRYQKHTPE